MHVADAIFVLLWNTLFSRLPHPQPHSSYLDFPALFNRSCSTPGSFLSSDRYLCNVGISDSLVKALPDVFGPLKGVRASSTCTWNPFPVYVTPDVIRCGDRSIYNVGIPASCLGVQQQGLTAYKVTPPGHCSLTGPANPTYTVNDTAAATSTGITGYFVSSADKCSGCGSGLACTCGENDSSYKCKSCLSGASIYLNFDMQMRNSDNTGKVGAALPHRMCGFAWSITRAASLHLLPPPPSLSSKNTHVCHCAT